MPPAAMVNLVTEKNARLTTALLAALLAAFGFFIVIPLSVTQVCNECGYTCRLVHSQLGKLRPCPMHGAQREKFYFSLSRNGF